MKIKLKMPTEIIGVNQKVFDKDYGGKLTQVAGDCDGTGSVIRISTDSAEPQFIGHEIAHSIMNKYYLNILLQICGGDERLVAIAEEMISDITGNAFSIYFSNENEIKKFVAKYTGKEEK